MDKKRRILKCWYSDRPLDEKIKRISKISKNSDIKLNINILKEILREKYHNLEKCPDTEYLIYLSIKMEQSLSYEEKLVISLSKRIKSIIQSDISIRRKIEEVKVILKDLPFQHQRKKLLVELSDMSKTEKKLFDYILKNEDRL